MVNNTRKVTRDMLIRQKDFASYTRNKKNILDIGLTFYNQALIDQKTNSQTIYGFDILKRQLPPGYDHFVQGDIQEISKYFSKDYFDIILLGEFIEHVILNKKRYETVKENGVVYPLRVLSVTN